MGRRITGHVSYDESRKSYRARFSYTDTNGKRKTVTRYGRTKTIARDLMQAEIDKLRLTGKQVYSAGREVSFRVLAEAYMADRLIPAILQEGKVIAGMRNTKSPRSFIAALSEYFGDMLITEIKPRHLSQYKLKRLAGKTVRGTERKISSVHRELEQMRAIYNYGVANDFLAEKDNPFPKSKSERLIEKKAERRRERLLSFGEELALLDQCEGDRAHLRAILIIALDTGLRRNELFTLEWDADISFQKKRITLRPQNAMTNVGRTIPMTQRVHATLLQLAEHIQTTKNREDAFGGKYIGAASESFDHRLVFGGTKEIKRSYHTALKLAGIGDLTFHDLRHAYITRTILSGVPPAVVLKASGHSSEEWKRYLNVDPHSMASLFQPANDRQPAAEVHQYGLDIMDGLAQSLGFVSQGANMLKYAESNTEG